MTEKSLVIIGCGPGGMSAALAARENGIQDILILERDNRPGGIMNQCIHSGFGIKYFGEELTGTEYALRVFDKIQEQGIELRLNTMVTDITPEKVITALTAGEVIKIKAGAIILAMGCRERPRGAINIKGTRPAGVITAGSAQKFVNICGFLPAKKVVILGSGDVGLIMARRLVLSGAEVAAVCEIMPRPAGLERNIVQCLNDFNIPLILNATVTEVVGKERVSAVVISDVDANKNPVAGTERKIECDTLLISIGLVPENELSQKAGVEIAENGGASCDEFLRTNVEGIFACGNVIHVHDIADNVSQEAACAGKNAASFLQNKDVSEKYVMKKSRQNEEEAPLANNERRVTCVICPVGCRVTAEVDSGHITNIRGNKCPRGANYIKEEFIAPKRTLTANMRGNGFIVSVKTKKPIPKELLLTAVKELSQIKISGIPKHGETVVKNIANTDIDIITTAEAVFAVD